MDFDFHVHTTYSDGSFIHEMIEAAESQGIKRLGFADHCNVSNRSPMQQLKRSLGFNLDITYKRRREAIQKHQKTTDVELLDAAELDFHPEDTGEIEKFLDKAGFEYTIGSVHHLENTNIHVASYFRQKSDEELYQLTDTYFDYLVKLIESELFDIAAHIDVIERNPAFRDKPDRDHYRQVAEAFKNSSTIPEVNAGRVLSELGDFHPRPDFMEILRSEGISFTLGTDAHTPGQLIDRKKKLEKEVEDTKELDLVEPV